MSGNVTQAIIEAAVPGPAASRVSQAVVEAIVPRISYSPSIPTGAAVTQAVVEAVVALPPHACITQLVVEALMPISTSPITSGGVAGFGWST